MDLLREAKVNNHKEFVKICNESPFVIMGFVKNIFKEKVKDIML